MMVRWLRKLERHLKILQVRTLLTAVREDEPDKGEWLLAIAAELEAFRTRIEQLRGELQ